MITINQIYFPVYILSVFWESAFGLSVSTLKMEELNQQNVWLLFKRIEQKIDLIIYNVFVLRQTHGPYHKGTSITQATNGIVIAQYRAIVR